MGSFGLVKRLFSSKYERDIYTYITVVIVTSLIVYKLRDVQCLPEIKKLGFGILSGILAGNVLFIISSLICNGSPSKVASELAHLFGFMPGFMLRHKEVLVKYIIISMYEEVFWRLFLQKGYFNQLWGVAAITLVFTLIHFNNKKVNLIPFFEFFLYFLALSLLYKFTDNLYLAIVIHAIRNIYITGRVALKEFMCQADKKNRSL